MGPAWRNPHSVQAPPEEFGPQVSTIEQKRKAEDDNECGRKPRSERGSACRYDQNPGGVPGMADDRVESLRYSSDRRKRRRARVRLRKKQPQQKRSK
jgi:hypothetical protein